MIKLRPLLILLLFVASVGILVWIYHSATHESAATASEPNPWTETLSDLDACCRRKHVKSVQYDHFADIASDEKYTQVARLFRAIALSERLQENNCAQAIVRLGGSYRPPMKVVVFHGPTDSNLERSISFEHKSLEELRSSDIDRAMSRDNRYAARMLIWASAGDLKHLMLMERCRRELRTTTGATTTYQICPQCGNLYESTYSDSYCPHCLTDGRKFIRFE